MQSTIAAIQTWGDGRKGTTDELIAALTVRLIHAEASLGHSARMPTDPLIKSVLDLAQGPTPLRVKTGLRVFTDGSCTANGRRGARAGIGVYATRDDVPIKSHSAPLAADEPQTNQRAELQALYHGLVFISEQPSPVANVYTDSKYSLDCLQKWSARWIKDNWRKADGKPVLHQDLLKPMVALWSRLSKSVTLHHVAAHTGNSDPLSVGNAKADESATMATGNTPTAGVTEAMVTGIRDPSDYSRTNGATISFGTTTGVKKTTMSFNPFAEPNILSML
jgi:ribonuclease HI